MKIFELINTFTPEEKKYVKKYFSAYSEPLQKLFDEIIVSDEESFKKNKQIILRKLFQKSWSDANEKYLWNQITNLFERLRDFIAQYWIDNSSKLVELNKTIHYLKSLKNRLNVDLYEKEWNYYNAKFYEDQYYTGLAELNLIHFHHLARNPKTISESKECLKKSYKYKLLSFKEDTSSLFYSAFNSNYSREIYGQENLIYKSDFDEIEAELELTYFDPMMATNHLLAETDPDIKWKYILDIFDILSDKDLELKEKTKFVICQSIFNYALILTYKNEIEKPKQIFEFIVAEDLVKSTVMNTTVFYFNYSTLLLKMNETDRAIIMHREVMNQLEGVHESKQTIFKIRNIFLNILHLDLENVYVDISEITPKLYKEDQQMYVRMLLVMYHIESKDIESALREADNAKKSKGMKAEIAAEEANIVECILALLLCITKENYNVEKLKKIEKMYISQPDWVNSNHLLKKWILNFYTKLLSQKYTY